jgi:hypothetical protein
VSAHFAADSDGHAQFENFLKRSPARIVSVIGHNEAGFFQFLDGHPVHLETLAKQCRALRKKCVFFSCDAQTIFRQFKLDSEIGADQPLNYLEAAKAAGALNHYLVVNSHQTVGNLLNDLPAVVTDVIRTQTVKATVRVIAEGAGVAVAGGGLLVTLNKEQR